MLTQGPVRHGWAQDSRLSRRYRSSCSLGINAAVSADGALLALGQGGTLWASVLLARCGYWGCLSVGFIVARIGRWVVQRDSGGIDYARLGIGIGWIGAIGAFGASGSSCCSRAASRASWVLGSFVRIDGGLVRHSCGPSSRPLRASWSSAFVSAFRVVWSLRSVLRVVASAPIRSVEDSVRSGSVRWGSSASRRSPAFESVFGFELSVLGPPLRVVRC